MRVGSLLSSLSWGERLGDETRVSTVFVGPTSPGARGLGMRLGSLLSLFQGPSLSWGKAGDVARVSTVFVSRPLVHVA